MYFKELHNKPNSSFVTDSNYIKQTNKPTNKTKTLQVLLHIRILELEPSQKVPNGRGSKGSTASPKQ